MNRSEARDTAVDSTTRRVLGIADYLECVRPRSPAAQERWKQLPSAAGLDDGATRRELQLLAQLDDELTSELIDDVDGDLRGLPTLERPLRRLAADQILRDADFFELKRFFFHGVSLIRTVDGAAGLAAADSAIVDLFVEAMETLHPDNAWSRRFHLADELDEQLATLRTKLRDRRQQLKSRRRQLEAMICAEHGGNFDIHGRFRPNDGSTIDDERLVDCGNGRYRVEDPELQELEQQHEALRDDVASEEHRQRRRLTKFIADIEASITEFHERLVEFDLRLTRIALRRCISGCWPTIDSETPVNIDVGAGRDPTLLETMDASNIQPIDLELTERGTVVLGPNMGGKSSVLRLVGALAWCAKMALPVPAAHCRIPSFDGIVYIGSEASEPGEETRGLSSFGREIRRFVEFWESDGSTLWLLDEPCRGTHPGEGTQLAAAIARQRTEAGDTVVMSTHFPGLAEASNFSRLRIAGLDVDDETLRHTLDGAPKDGRRLHERLVELMDYRVVADDDGAVPRDGWRIARALGLDIPRSDRS